MKYIFESLPIILALYAALVCARQYALDRRKQYKRVLLLGVLCSVLLILAQTSWLVSSAVQGNMVGTWLADQVWTLFNSTTMLAFILLAHGGRPDVAKSSSSRD